jgi:type III pantothenate kinase
MLLAMDVGNTNTVLGLFDGDALVADWRVRTERDITTDELGILLRNLFLSKDLDSQSVTAVIISSVVPPLNNVLEELSTRYFNVTAMFISHAVNLGMPILYDNPKEVGADRIVNAVAAYDRYQQALVIVDFGTATTFDYISARGEYVGGAIAPGLFISSEALFQKASKLPRVEIFARPKRAVARDTISSMNAGLVLGYAGLVDGLVSRIKQEVEDEPRVIATGGLASLIASMSDTIDEVSPDLTLDGLKILYRLNVQG